MPVDSQIEMAGGKPVVLPLRPPEVSPGTQLKASDWKLDEVASE
jgi:hypothetical protein